MQAPRASDPASITGSTRRRGVGVRVMRRCHSAAAARPTSSAPPGHRGSSCQGAQRPDAAAVVIVIVVEVATPCTATLDGAKLQVARLGSPAHEKLTCPV